MLVLGIDPGTAITGYGLVDEVGSQLVAVEYGVIRTPANSPLPERLASIYQALQDTLKQHRPTQIALEELFFSSNTRSALAVGQARGVCMLAGAHAGIPIFEYTPLQVKLAIAGYGRATKSQIQAMVRLLLNLDAIPSPDDAADALALAICHLHTKRPEELSIE